MEMFEKLKFRLSPNHLNKFSSKDNHNSILHHLRTQMKHFPVGPAGENSQGEFLSSFKEIDSILFHFPLILNGIDKTLMMDLIFHLKQACISQHTNISFSLKNYIKTKSLNHGI